MVWRWSKTAATNSNADSTINWAEGMAPSAVNDSARAEMARVAQWRDDISGAIVTGGTSTAYTVSSNQVFDTLAHMDGAMIAFTPHVINGATVTLNVDGLGSKPLRLSPAVELQSNTLIAGTPYVATYSNADAAWYLRGLGGNPYGIPLGAGMDFWLPTSPSSAFAFPIGQAISRTTYSALFAQMGTTHGSGDGSTTFNLPNKMGRASVMKETTASVLSPAYFGADSTVIGAKGGVDSLVLSVSQIQSFTPTVASITQPAFSYKSPGENSTGGSGPGPEAAVRYLGAQGTFASPQTQNVAITMNPIGSGFPHGNIQPSIVCNYIMRII